MADKILYPHNVEQYKKLNEAFEYKNKACAIQPTGTGKMYLAIKWLDEHPNEPFVYIAPTNVILNSFIDKLTEIYFPNQESEIKKLSIKEQVELFEKSFNLKLMTYAKVNNLTDDEMKEISASKIVLDEFHHLGAEKWGASVERFLNIHENAQILGLSATPVRASDGKDMVEYLFGGETDAEITLKECFEKEILTKPTLINGIYSFEEEIISIEQSLKNKNFSSEKRKEIEEKLKQAKKLIGKSHHGIKDIFAENLKQFERENGKLDTKLIVFCNSIEDRHKKMEECKTWFKLGTKIKKYSVTSEEDKETVNKVIKNFEEDNAKCVKLIFVVNMLNEGLHIKGVDGVVMLRSTESYIVFTQQLGRALSVAREDNKKSPLVFDLTNNIEVLAEDIEEVQKTGLKFTRGIKDEKGILEDTIFNIQAEIIDIIQYLKSITLTFQDRIAPLVEYYKQHGTIADIETKNGKLGNLVSSLRNEYKKGKLTPEKVETLEKMGMIWDVHNQSIRPEVKKFVDEFLEYLKTHNGNNPNRNKENKHEDSLYSKWCKYTNSRLLSEEEIDYLLSKGIEVRKIEHKISTIPNVSAYVQYFVQEYLEFVKANKRTPKDNREDRHEVNLYNKYLKYTNLKNLKTKEEIEFLKENGIELREIDNRINEIPNVRIEVQDFTKKFLEFKSKNKRDPKGKETSREEMNLYQKWKWYTNLANLKSKEEIEYLQSYGFEIREIDRMNKIPNVRFCVQDFVEKYLKFLEENDGEKPTDNRENKEECNLYNLYIKYTNPKNLKSKEEIEYLQSNGIEFRKVGLYGKFGKISNVRKSVINFVREYNEFFKLHERRPHKSGEELFLYKKLIIYTNPKNLEGKEEIEYIQANGIELKKPNQFNNVRISVQKFVKEYLEFIKEKGRNPSGYNIEELSLYNKYVTYTNSKNLSQEEKEYLQANNIKVRTVAKSSTDDGFKPD